MFVFFGEIVEVVLEAGVELFDLVGGRGTF